MILDWQLQEHLDNCYTRVLRVLVFWKIHPTIATLYGDLPTISVVVERLESNLLTTRCGNCRAMLDHARLIDLDAALSDNNIYSVCPSRDLAQWLLLYIFQQLRRQHHMENAVAALTWVLLFINSVPGSDGRLMIKDLLLHNTIHQIQLMCAYASTNSSPAATRN